MKRCIPAVRVWAFAACAVLFSVACTEYRSPAETGKRLTEVCDDVLHPKPKKVEKPAAAEEVVAEKVKPEAADTSADAFIASQAEAASRKAFPVVIARPAVAEHDAGALYKPAPDVKKAAEQAAAFTRSLKGKTEALADDAKPLFSALVLGGVDHTVVTIRGDKGAYKEFALGTDNKGLAFKSDNEKAGVMLWSGAEDLEDPKIPFRAAPLEIGDQLAAVRMLEDGSPVSLLTNVVGVPKVEEQNSLETFDAAQGDSLIKLGTPDLQELHGAVLIDAGGRVAGYVVPTGSDKLAAAIPSRILAALCGKPLTGDVPPDRPDFEKFEMGAQLTQLFPNEAQAFGVNVPPVAVVNDVQAEAPAGRAGMKVGDVVIGFGGEILESLDDLLARIAAHDSRIPITLTVLREGGQVTLVIPVRGKQAVE